MRRWERPPSLEAVRTSIAPRITSAWALKIREVKLTGVGHVHILPVSVLLPSDHVRRAFAYQSIFKLFFQDDRSGPEKRKWHPECCDSRIFHDRAELLRYGGILRAFVVEG